VSLEKVATPSTGHDEGQEAQLKPTGNPSEAPDVTTLVFQFEVEDTGQGVLEHLQQEIFKPFIQGDLALSKKYGGTGLELAILRPTRETDAWKNQPQKHYQRR